MIFDEINELEKKGVLKLFLKTGIISVRVKCQYDIYAYYKNEIVNNKALKCCISQSITNTADAFKISERHVYNAIKTMKQ